MTGDEEPGPGPTREEAEQALGQILVGAEAAGRPVLNGSPVRRGNNNRAQRTDRPAREAAAIRRPRWTGRAVLAAAILVGGLGVFWWARPVTQAVDPGERLALTLPDGSRVELNSGSRLRYARRFGEERTVYLTGEAFFEVVEEGRPFVVETFNAQVRVLGTRFGVRAWPGGLAQGTTVALASGRVALAPAGQPQRAVNMTPGEIRRVDANAAAVGSYNPGMSVDDATAWRRGDLVFKDQFLGIILEDVERRFSVDIQVHPRSLQRKRLNLALRQPADAEAVVHDLAVALGLRYRGTSNGYELYAEAP